MPPRRSERIRASQVSATAAQCCCTKLTDLPTELRYRIYSFLVQLVMYRYCMRSFDREDNPIPEGSMIRISPRDESFLAVLRTCRLLYNDWPVFMKLITLKLQVYPVHRKRQWVPRYQPWNLQLPPIVWRNVTKLTVSLPGMTRRPDWNTLEICAMAFVWGIEDDSAVTSLAELTFVLEEYKYLAHGEPTAAPHDNMALFAGLVKKARRESTKVQLFDWSQVLEILRPGFNSCGQFSYSEA